MPVIDGIIVPTESAELVLDAYQEVIHQQQQEAFKKKRAQVLKRWRLVIKGMVLHTRLMEEYGDSANSTQLDDDEDDWEPKDAIETPRESEGEMTIVRDDDHGGSQPLPQDAEQEDSGGGFMFD